MIDLKTVVDLVSGRSPDDLARIAAYLLAPGLVLVLGLSGVYSPGLAIDFARPVAISYLQTHVDGRGQITGKKGLAVVLEPVPAEYSITLKGSSGMWLSLDEATARANGDRLAIGPTALSGRSPLMGVSDAVTVVVEGDAAGQILVPGGAESLDDWRSQSRRSTSLVSSVLLACVFAFGMSLAIGLPSPKSNEDGARQKRA